MITKIVHQTESTYTAEYRGLSTDVKPVIANNGDVFYEMDTRKAFMYDLTNKQWLPMNAS